MNSIKLSIERIFWTDHTTATSTIAVVVAWGFYLFDKFIQKLLAENNLLYIALPITLVGISLMIWRIRLIKSAFEDGREVTGIIETVSFYRDRGRISYIYSFDGNRYRSVNSVMKHRITSGLQQGQEVAIMANNDNPKIAFIRDIYV
jgi:hypothetical protein